MSVLMLQRDKDGTLVKLAEHLDIRCAKELYVDLDKALARKPKKIIFDAGNLTHIDTAALQLLVACTQEAKRQKKTVNWLKVSEEFRECAEFSGVSEVLGLQ